MAVISAKIQQNLINHVFFSLDASSSMLELAKEVVQVADSQIKYLAERSTVLDQETRATVYTFNTQVVPHFYDKDVLRLPSMQGLYHPRGMTALIDATIQAVEDLEKTATLYGDHAFLGFVATDGEENRSFHSKRDLQQTLNRLPDNWSIGVLVPNETGRRYAEEWGFSAGNIMVWEVSAAGLMVAANKVQQATEQFMQNRAIGIRGSKSIFQTSTQAVDFSTIAPLKAGEYELIPTGSCGDVQIRDFVEIHSQSRKTYRKGCAYYQLTKREEIQPNKDVAVLDTKTQLIYSGKQARAAVGLPVNQRVDAIPEGHADKIIFVQSNSVNRKLVPNTMLLIR